MVALLLQQPRIEINIPDDNGSTPLHVPAINGAFPELDLVELLLKHPRININAKPKEGYTALHWAGCSNREELLELLLNQAEIDKKATSNREASLFGNFERS